MPPSSSSFPSTGKRKRPTGPRKRKRTAEQLRNDFGINENNMLQFGLEGAEFLNPPQSTVSEPDNSESSYNMNIEDGAIIQTHPLLESPLNQSSASVESSVVTSLNPISSAQVIQIATNNEAIERLVMELTQRENQTTVPAKTLTTYNGPAQQFTVHNILIQYLTNIHRIGVVKRSILIIL